MDHRKLYNLSKLNMDILYMDKVVLTQRWKASDISSSFTRIYVVTDGVGWLKYGGNVLQMTPGNIYVVPAGLTFSYGCEDGFSKIFFHVSVRHPGEYDILHGLNRCIAFPGPDGVELIKSNFDFDTIAKITQTKAYLYDLIYKCASVKENISVRKYSDYVAEIMKYVDKNLSANLTVEKIAGDIFTSPGKLRKTFRDETGIPIGKYIDDQVMFTAELDVCNGELSIKSISDRLGFCDQFYFSRCFSKKYGISPANYRKKQTYK